jgi:uncharacterized membrane protein
VFSIGLKREISNIYQAFPEEVNNMAVDKSNENLMGAAAYLGAWITGIIFLLIEKDSKFVRFHAMQSLILFGGLSVLSVGLQLLPILGQIISFFLFFGGFIMWIVCMWKAFQGEMYKVPYVGEIAEKQLAKMK